jgi:hypothetical protein
MAHTLRPARKGRATPASFERSILGNMPKRRAGFSWCFACKGATRSLAVHPLGSCLWSISITEILANVVTFVLLTLRQTTHTVCNFQGSPGVFSQRSKKVERQIWQGLQPPSPHHCHSGGLACGELQPFSPNIFASPKPRKRNAHSSPA